MRFLSPGFSTSLGPCLVLGSLLQRPWWVWGIFSFCSWWHFKRWNKFVMLSPFVAIVLLHILHIIVTCSIFYFTTSKPLLDDWPSAFSFPNHLSFYHCWTYQHALVLSPMLLSQFPTSPDTVAVQTKIPEIPQVTKFHFIFWEVAFEVYER